MIARLFSGIAALSLLAAAPSSGMSDDPPDWTAPTRPFRIAGNIYYVGTQGLAAYLIATRDGLILIDATVAANVPMIEASIRALGFRLADVKILLNSHAHFDHAGGLAAIKRDTGARLSAMRGDVWGLEHGRHDSDQNYVGRFAPVKVDRVLRDGATITLGDTRLTAIATPGHTKGCTTFLMPFATDAGRKVAVFPCSLSVAGNVLVGNRRYPGIVADYRRSFDRMAAIRADLVLPAHPELAGVLTRSPAERFAPGLLQTMVAASRADFERACRTALTRTR